MSCWPRQTQDPTDTFSLVLRPHCGSRQTEQLQFVDEETFSNYVFVRTKARYTEISGTGSDYSAYSTLQSPWMDVRQASCLSFDFAQTLPSKLAVVVNDTCVFRAPDKQLTQFQPGVVSLSPGNVTLNHTLILEPVSIAQLRSITIEEGSCAIPGNCFATSKIENCPWTSTNSTVCKWDSGNKYKNFLGPTEDHTTDGNNMYFWMNLSALISGESCSLQSVLSRKAEAGDEGCLRFWYHMDGEGDDSLSVSILSGSLSPNEKVLWTKSSDDTKPVWSMGAVKIESVLPFKSPFRSVYGHSGNTWKFSSVALDDIEFTYANDCEDTESSHNGRGSSTADRLPIAAPEQSSYDEIIVDHSVQDPHIYSTLQECSRPHSAELPRAPSDDTNSFTEMRVRNSGDPQVTDEDTNLKDSSHSVVDVNNFDEIEPKTERTKLVKVTRLPRQQSRLSTII
ncbi:hypothetical protein C0Q70_05125 [Pomacea canaliculata]|uniref:MAM domain-containing protein n=1 Tax=Pomacea canaliculata TaxID=400727 RepID=A0A2T7PKA9_POMCA|nr:hypothetical protein C0Q70_05125 [Pomacea canaliculata]